MSESCGTCRFVKATGGTPCNTHECRRNPPAYESGVKHAKHPYVRIYDWCGEWQAAPVAPSLKGALEAVAMDAACENIGGGFLISDDTRRKVHTALGLGGE